MKDGRSISFLTHLEQVINEKNPTLILCIIPSSRGDIYSLIKRKLCIDRAGKSNIFNLLFCRFIILSIFFFLCLNT